VKQAMDKSYGMIRTEVCVPSVVRI
jgi:hypothetical protein